MNPGKLNKIIRIEYPTMEEDAFGGEVEGWAEYATVWAAVYPIKGRELIAAQAVQSQLTTTFEIRYLAGVTSEMRIVYEGKNYELGAPPIDPQEKHEKLQLMTKCL